MKDNLIHRVIRWENDENTSNKEISIGGLGGFFNAGLIHKNQKELVDMRWKNYVSSIKPDTIPYAEAIRESVLKNNIRFTGKEHQNSDQGVPVFEDDTIGSFSFRAWGDIMAAIWSEEENKNYTYMDFYY